MLTQKMKNMPKIYTNIKENFYKIKNLNGVDSGQNMCFGKKERCLCYCFGYFSLRT